MFEPHFGLRENPFSTSHDPRFVYPSPEHLEAVAHFRYGVQNREAFVLVSGEVGTGKTTAVRDLVARLPQQAHVALLQNTALSRHELLEELCQRFSVPWDESLSKPALLGRLESTLGERLDRGETCILIIDEAQDLSSELLEEIRLLSNLEWRGGHLLHICLAGQPELEERLARPELRPLRQRISVKYRIQPLDLKETERYIHHRLRVAGGDGERIFPSDAAAAVHELTHGIPREINIVAGQALLNAYVDGAPCVRPQHIRQVADEFGFQSVLERPRAAAPAEPAMAPPAAVAPLVPVPPPVPAPAAPSPPPAPPSLPAPGGQAAAVVPISPRPAVPPTPQPARVPAPEPVASRFAEPPAPLTPALPPAPQASAPPGRTVGNWRERAPQPAPRAPAPARGSRGPMPEERGPSVWRRVPLWVPVTGALLVLAVLLVSSGVVGRLWRSASSSGEEESATVPAEVRPVRRMAPVRRAAPPVPATVATPAPAGSAFAIQAASFRTERKARAALAELQRATGLAGTVVTAASAQGNWYRVVMGGFATQEEATAKSADLLARHVVPSDRIVVRAGAAAAAGAPAPTP